MNLSSLTAIGALISAGVNLAHDYASVAPSLVTGAETILANGKKVVTDVEGVVSNIKAGKYEDTETGVAAALSDFGSAIASVTSAIPTVASMVKKAATLPSTFGLAAALKAI